MAVLKVFDGDTWVEAPGDHSLSLLGFFNGIFLESFTARITSDGVHITMTLERAGGGDLTMNFSGNQQTTLDCTPALTTDTDTGVLTAGADDVPVSNYVYIPRSTKVLTASTSDWPSEEHIRVGFFYLPSASFVNTYGGGYINQNWVDHIQDTATGMGHMAHMAERARRLTDVWRSGCGGVATQQGDDLWISVAAGVVWQMHKHTFAAQNSDTAAAGDPILVANDPDANFTVINSLNEITKLSDGDSIGTGKYVKFGFWAAANETGEFQPIFVNVPDEQYNTAADAMADVEGYTNLTIPIPFSVDSSIGFLIMAVVCQNTASGMILQDTTDLRGQTPQTAGGGMGGGDVTSLAALVDNTVIRGDGGAKGVQDTGITVDDSDNMSGVGKVTINDSASVPPLNVTERSAAPSAPSAHDIYLDDGTNTRSGKPGWRRYTGSVWEDLVASGPPLGGVFSVRNPVAGKYYLIAKASVAMTITRISGQVVDGTNVTVEYWINDEDEVDEAGATELYGGGGKTFVAAHDADTSFTNANLTVHQTLWAKVDAVTGAVTQLLTDYEWEPT